jgi:Zn-dependent peptidase ImmA (M78 family)
MRRGFKAWAESIASEKRIGMGLQPHSPLPARLLASKLGVEVVAPAEIPGMTPLWIRQLLEVDPSAWSALTLPRKQGSMVILNVSHSARRQESDLMHELAHLLCGHEPGGMVHLNGASFALRTNNPVQEEEAVWLGGCLHLPRRALLWAIGANMSAEEMSEHFKASPELVRMRRSLTGVDRQLALRRNTGPSNS